MHLLFRADATTKIGSGHVMRCLALAEAWKARGGAVLFAGDWQQESLVSQIRDVALPSPGEQGKIVTIKNVDESARELESMGVQMKPEAGPADWWYVLDGYHFDLEHQKKIKDVGHKLLVIDDNAHLPKYDCDILVNHNAHAKSLKYKVNKDCKLLLGPEYALIRSEFREWRDRREPHEARRVLVALGSAATEELKALVRGALNAIECESRWAEGDAHLPSLMAWADVGILAAGVVSLEACYMGLPSVLLVTAENQKGNAFALDAAWCGSCIPASNARIMANNARLYATALLDSPRDWRDMRERQMEMVDGKGAERVVEVMLGE